MSKKKEEVIASLIIPKSDLEKKFEEAKEEVTSLAKRCSEVVVIDEVSYNTALSILKEGADTLKVIEEKRTSLKKPYLDTGNAIDAIAKEIKLPLEVGIASGKDKIKAYQQEEEKKRLAKLEEIKQEQERTSMLANDKVLFLEQLRLHFSQLYQKFTTIIIHEVDWSKTEKGILDLLTKGFEKPSHYLHYKEDARTFREFIDTIKAWRLNFIAAGDEADKIECDKIMVAFTKFKIGLINKINTEIQEIENLKIGSAVANVTEFTEVSSEKLGNSRVKWRFEITDSTKIPDKYWVLSEFMVNQTISENKDMEGLDGNTTLIPGIKIIKDTTVVLR